MPRPPSRPPARTGAKSSGKSGSGLESPFRKARSPSGRNAPQKDAPRSGASARGTSARGTSARGTSARGNFSTRDGKEGFRTDDGDRKPYKPRGERPDRSERGSRSEREPRFDGPRNGSRNDRPDRSSSSRPSSDRPKRDFGDRPKRDFGDRPSLDRPKRDFGDRPKRDFGDKPKRDFGDRPKRDFGDRPKRDFGNKPKRDFGGRPSSDRPKRDFGDRPKRDFGDRPKRDFGDRAPSRGRSFDRSSDRDSAPRTPRKNISVYGLHASFAAITNPARKIKAIYAVENNVDEIQQHLDQALEAGLERPEITVVEREVLNKALPREATHQGIGLDASGLDETLLADVIRKADVTKKSVVILLDQVTDPHNVGAILRSACAFGADAVIMQERNAPELSGLIAKTASGAAEHMPLVYETNMARTIDTFKEAGFFALALDERGSTITEAPAYAKTLLVLGAEGRGLRANVKEHCDLLVKLPTDGPISSHNVSNAAAVALFAIKGKAA